MKKRGNTVLIVDGGGRGTALVDKYAQSPHVDKIIAVPGNDLMQDNTLNKEIQIFPELKTTDVKEIVDLCKKKKIDLVDVASDNAIASGLVDVLGREGISTVGPTKAAGQIEWSKVWAREFGRSNGLPQPRFEVFYSQEGAIKFLQGAREARRFIKADGLAQGKGALPAKDKEEAIRRVGEMERFGKEAEAFLIEDWMQGEEFSAFIISDGKDFKIVGTAQDYKREKDNDEGENTGSMGSSSEPSLLTPALLLDIQNIFDKTIKGLNRQRRMYKGVLYLGGMIVDDRVEIVEFNARWGDPEAQVILPSLVNDLFEVSMAIVSGNITGLNLRTDGRTRVAVTAASKGYPGDYSKAIGKEIHGLNEARKVNGVKIYGAGVKRVGKKDYVAGGRLFYVVGEGKNVVKAREKAYEAMSLVNIEGNNLHYRKDIGWRDVERLRGVRRGWHI